ncbi:hypothetical protein JCM5350_005046 [Sporobolomyces pararoseus]
MSIELHLDEKTRTLELPSTSPFTLTDFLDRAAQSFQLDSSAQALTSFTYEDEDGDQILVSSPEEFAEFLSFVDDSSDHTRPVVHLTLSSTSTVRPQAVRELLEKVKEAIKADHSIARDLRDIVREVCGPRPDHRRQHSSPPHHHHRGERGGIGRGRGGHRSRERGRGPYDRGHRRGHGHGHESDGISEDHPHSFPPPYPPHFGWHAAPPPPPPHHGSCQPLPPPPPPMWNVERTIREHWSPIPQGPPPFHRGPGSHHSYHPYSHAPPFPPPMCQPRPPFPRHGFEFDNFHPHCQSRSRRHRPGPPSPPPPHDRSRRHRFPSEEEVDREDGEDWEFEFEKLRV